MEESREDAETTIASVLKYFLKDTLNTRKYEEIRKVERNSTLKNTRLFVALGNNDNISPKKNWLNLLRKRQVSAKKYKKYTSA